MRRCSRRSGRCARARVEAAQSCCSMRRSICMECNNNYLASLTSLDLGGHVLRGRHERGRPHRLGQCNHELSMTCMSFATHVQAIPNHDRRWSDIYSARPRSGRVTAARAHSAAVRIEAPAVPYAPALAAAPPLTTLGAWAAAAAPSHTPAAGAAAARSPWAARASAALRHSRARSPWAAPASARP